MNKYTYKVPFTKEQLQIDYAAGLSQTEIGKRYGASQKVVWRAMKKLGIAARKAAPRNQVGENNNNWRGDEVCYAAFHKRVEAINGRPKKCEVCGTVDAGKTYDWANLTGRYEDPKDYKRMCRSCHRQHDKRMRLLLERKRGDTSELR